MKPMVYREK